MAFSVNNSIGAVNYMYVLTLLFCVCVSSVVYIRAQQGASGSSPAEILASIEHAKKLKQQLQRTSFVVGFDPEYE